MLAPWEGAIGIDLDRPMMGAERTKHADYASFHSGHGIAWRPSGKVGRGDMNAVGRPLRYAVDIKTLQPRRPTVIALVKPLHVGITRRNIG